MKRSMLAFLALAAVLLPAAPGGYGPLVIPMSSPAPKKPAGTAPVSDPAEPAPKVELSSGGSGLSVASSARGTAVKFRTTGAWQGSAGLTFKGAPPMRFTLTLAQMPAHDLASLTVVSGSLSLAVGPVSASATTKYYDARGRAQAAPEGAAYTVTARRWDGELDVEVRRAPGAALGKALTVSWQGNLNYGGRRPWEEY
jgi:hypothetical protein